jgi:hypothetical protein
MRRVLLAGAILITGCGAVTSTTGSRSANSPARTGAAATATAATGARATATAATATAATATEQAPLDQRFLVLGNFVCRTVRAGAPGPLGTAATRHKLVSHAAAAAVPAQRTAVSLERLAAETSHRTALAPLVAAYQSLAGLYRAELAPKLTAAQSFSVARAIVETEQLAGGTARSLGLPACAPAPAGR